MSAIPWTNKQLDTWREWEPTADSYPPETLSSMVAKFLATIDEKDAELARLREIERCAAGVVLTARPDITDTGVVPAWWTSLQKALEP